MKALIGVMEQPGAGAVFCFLAQIFTNHGEEAIASQLPPVLERKKARFDRCQTR